MSNLVINGVIVGGTYDCCRALLEAETIRAQQVRNELQLRVANGLPLQCDLELDKQFKG